MIGGKTKVVFACKDCGQAFICVQERQRSPQAGGFDCTECGATVYRWAGAYAYSGWRQFSSES
jgi:predicted RNA-binding Zn-ribbon protein involved in translation (DUF1610 family)